VVYDAVTAADDEHTTIRASWDRRLVTSTHETDTPEVRKLRARLSDSTARGHYALKVSAGPKRSARIARVEVRFAQVTLDLRDKKSSQHRAASVTAVLAREVSPVPPGEDPIEWLLLTTYPVTDFEAACEVVLGYSFRWRVEEFHKAMKSGGCDVEASQLSTLARRQKWYAIASAVAARLLRLTYLARERPETLAQTELTPDEHRALEVLSPRRPLPARAKLTIAEAVLRIATLGGYTGKSSGGPPGMITLSRGLQRVSVVAKALRNQREIEQNSPPISLDTPPQPQGQK
jgi:hypothetical protein